MEYYQILKQRRLALGLSIQDISNQTRLAPQYIQAVEENNLMAFNEDFLFIRRFTQAYCEAIGVNWQAVSQDVENNISAYAQRSGIVLEEKSENGDIATDSANRKGGLRTSQRKKIRNKPKPRKRKQASNHAIGNIIQRINESEHARLYQIGAIALALILVLSLVNIGMSYQTSKQQAAEEAARQSEIKQKEAETKRLASQKSTSEKDNNNITVTATDKDNNMYDIDGIVDDSKEMTLKISVPEDTTIAVYKDDELLTDDADQVYTSTFEKTFKVNKACTIQVEIGTYANNTITVNGKKVSFSKANWEKGTPAVLYFNLKSEKSNSDSKDSDTNEESTTDTSTTDSADTSTDSTNNQTTTTDSSMYDASATNGVSDDTANVDTSTYDTYTTQY